jgi:hypothetical protein
MHWGFRFRGLTSGTVSSNQLKPPPFHQPMLTVAAQSPASQVAYPLVPVAWRSILGNFYFFIFLKTPIHALYNTQEREGQPFSSSPGHHRLVLCPNPPVQ